MSRWFALAVVLLVGALACATATGGAGAASTGPPPREPGGHADRVPAGSAPADTTPAAQEQTETWTPTTTGRPRRSPTATATPTAAAATPTASEVTPTATGAASTTGGEDDPDGIVAETIPFLILVGVVFLVFVVIPRYLYLKVREEVRTWRGFGDQWDDPYHSDDDDGDDGSARGFILETAVLTVLVPARAAAKLARLGWRVVGYPYRRRQRRRDEHRQETESRVAAAEDVVRDSGIDTASDHASAGRLREAQAHYQDGEYEEAMQAAEEAIDLAGRERAVRERIEEVTVSDEEPNFDAERVRDLLSAARDALESGDVDAAEDAVAEAERLAGPPVEYLLGEARQVADEARAAREDGRLDDAVDQWRTARERYERALDRAAELDSDLRADIEDGIADVDERLSAARRDRRDQRLRAAATDAWDAVVEGDDRLTDGEFEAAAAAYTRALEAYEDTLERARDHEQVEADDIGAAVETLRAARTDCSVAQLAEQTRVAVEAFAGGDRERADERFRTVLDDLGEVDRDLPELRAVVERGRVAIRLDRARDRAGRAEERFDDGEYYEAEEGLDAAREALVDAESTLEATADLADLRAELTDLRDRLDAHEGAVQGALTAVDEVPSLDPVETIETAPRVTPGDVPDPRSLCRHVPVSDRVWEAVGADESARTALVALADTVADSGVAARVDDDIARELRARATRVRQRDPVVGAQRLDDDREALVGICVDAVAALEDRLAETLDRLTASDLPADAYDRPAVADESLAESLRETDDLSAFTDEFDRAVDSLLAALDGVRDTASTLDAYDEIADRIATALEEEGEVTGDDLPVREPARFLELYHRQHPETTFDPDGPVLRE